MLNFKPFDLKGALAIHNLILTVWSLAMFLESVVDIYLLYEEKGLEGIYCPKAPSELKGRLYYGLYIYYISKFYELLDTVFKVLKKVRTNKRKKEKEKRKERNNNKKEPCHFSSLVSSCNCDSNGLGMG